jgi:hypothetical protein
VAAVGDTVVAAVAVVAVVGDTHRTNLLS